MLCELFCYLKLKEVHHQTLVQLFNSWPRDEVLLFIDFVVFLLRCCIHFCLAVVQLAASALFLEKHILKIMCVFCDPYIDPIPSCGEL